MDSYPSENNLDTGLGAWHPAIRPNTQGQEREEDLVVETTILAPDGQHGSSGIGIPHSSHLLLPDAGDYDGSSPPTLSDLEHRSNENSRPSHGSEVLEEAGSHEQKIKDGQVKDELNRWNHSNMDTADPRDSHNGFAKSTDDSQHGLHEAEIDVTEDSARKYMNSTNEEHREDSFGDKLDMEEAFESEATGTKPGDLGRTNSFPAVPLMDHVNLMPMNPLPYSQVQDIMEADAPNFDDRHQESNDTSHIANGHGPLSQDSFASIGDGEDAAFFADDGKADLLVPDIVQESRYEEGLPLIGSEPWQEKSLGAQDPQHYEQSPGSEGKEMADSAVDRVVPTAQEDIALFNPSPLDRKSTNQVLDSIHYAPHSTNHEVSEITDDRTSLADLNGGGIAVPRSNVQYQVLAEHQADVKSSDTSEADLAELWKAALADDDLLEDDGTSMDPSTFFGDDDGFLEDLDEQADGLNRMGGLSPPIWESELGAGGRMQEFEDNGNGQVPAQKKYLQASASQPSSNVPAAYHGAPRTLQLSRPEMTAFGQTSSVNTDHQQPFSVQSTSRPQMPASTQSFADKSKGGYTSPYDLPMDVTRPKKRTVYQQVHPNSETQSAIRRPPPPRSSSMFTGGLSQLQSQPPQKVSGNYPSNQIASIPPSQPKLASNHGSFFEDLTPSVKPRPSTSAGRILPPASQTILPQAPPMFSQNPQPNESFPSPSIPDSSTATPPYQLLPPERLGIYSNEYQAHTPLPALPVANTRYSPAPLQPTSAPVATNRYAASPANGQRPPLQGLPFQPRTSSPLAQSHSVSQQSQSYSMPTISSLRLRSNGDQGPALQHSANPNHSLHSQLFSQTIDPRNNHERSVEQLPNDSQPGESPSFGSHHYEPQVNTPSDSSYAINTPEHDRSSSDGSNSVLQSKDIRSNAPRFSHHGPPLRSQTQSPGAARYKTEHPTVSSMPYQRPASVNHHASSQPLGAAHQVFETPGPRQENPSAALVYITPSDGQEMDPLGRWKGCPIFSFGFGGSIVTSFPKQVPRYAVGQKSPMIKCSPGEISIRDAKILPLGEEIVAFPGPLKSKSKKKDVLDWLQNRIASLNDRSIEPSIGAVLPDPKKRHDEKILLWQIMKIIVEYDGAIDRSPLMEKAVRSILSPETLSGDTTDAIPQPLDTPLLGIKGYREPHSIPGSPNVEAVERIRKMLLYGEREKAVWHAVDNRLWAHALLLSSTLDKDTWKQVSQEFVRQEIKTSGENAESLAAVYQIFAGNWEESVDELVPPSARAGLQMVSKSTSTGPIKNALDGLDRWRETLTLILSNCTADDGRALVALGQLLSSYGRVEAAHVCFLFAKIPSLFGGIDDPGVSVVLLGADHLLHPFDYARDFDSILLTEVYDYACTVLASATAATVSPHLQSYKLYHAIMLAEYGLRSEAHQYCEVITSALNSTTKRSPYYHNLLLGALENIVDRLRQAPQDVSGSWISKPSIDKVSGSLWAKFNQYVAGDDSDAVSTGSGKIRDAQAGSADAGPFAGVTEKSPDISRTPSSGDLYASYVPAVGMSASGPMPKLTNSRYAPGGTYTPRYSLEQSGRSLQDVQRPSTHELLRPLPPQLQYQSRPTSSAGSYDETIKPLPLSSSYVPQTDSYLHTPSSQSEEIVAAPRHDPQTTLYQQEAYQPANVPTYQSDQEQYRSDPNSETSNGYQSLSSPDVTLSSGYEPLSYNVPTTSSYDPPSYSPESLVPAQSPAELTQQKRSFMDDDDDGSEARAATLRKAEKARKDYEAEEAFRKAAEADGDFHRNNLAKHSANMMTALKDTVPKLNSKKSGWFGGWLGSKKEGDAPMGTPNAPIKAKLGEQSSFYYDAEKKRWIDKKNPEATSATSAPPPPPKGPPSRAVSAAGGPPPPSTTVPPVPSLPAAINTSQTNGITQIPSQLPSSRPPSQQQSRSQTPASQPSEETTTGTRSISMPLVGDLPSGPPSAPPSRPSTGMSGANNIDDLIGAPQARKGGTVRKAKKGRGYVDVMAK